MTEEQLQLAALVGVLATWPEGLPPGWPEQLAEWMYACGVRAPLMWQGKWEDSAL